MYAYDLKIKLYINISFDQTGLERFFKSNQTVDMVY